ncbi:MAG: DnaJ family molecular chaperone [Caldimicrobium sp.]
MKKLKINPFEYFGLTPQFLKEHDDGTIFKIIKSIYRTLQMSYHPDRGGDPKKALELNLAFELINLEKDPQAFKHYKNAYIQRLSRKTLKKELEELQNFSRKLTYINELLKERFWLFLEKGSEQINSLFHQGLALKIKLLDVISQINFGNIVGFKNKKRFFKEIIFGPNYLLKKTGEMKKYQVFKKYKIMGAVKREYITPWHLMERNLKEERFYVKNYMTKETFIREILIYLSPELKANYYLFFYHEKDPSKVYLEGLILKLEEISYLEFLEILRKESIEPSESVETDEASKNSMVVPGEF